MVSLRKYLSRLNPDASVKISDKALIASFTDDRTFPYLVSFPRTGSHWLRMLMELYFEKPSLVRAFYYKDAVDFSCYHHHDEDLTLSGRDNVIYLYRNPVDTVYSQLRYYKQKTDDEQKIREWSCLYGRHLQKWLINERCPDRKTVLSYEGLSTDLHNEFSKLVAHFGQVLDAGRLDDVARQVSKTSLKKRTSHDKQVVNTSESYAEERDRFRSLYTAIIFSEIYSVTAELEKFLTAE
jgi:hypothetical protein